jgi:hypothetical protein
MQITDPADCPACHGLGADPIAGTDCPACDGGGTVIARPGARTVTITDASRVIWTGSYASFQRENLDSISVAEFCELEHTGTLTIGGGAAPALQVTLERSPQLDAPERPGAAKSERPQPAPNMRRDMRNCRATAR